MTTVTPDSQATHTGYGYGREVDIEFGKAIDRAKELLKDEGFGVLCEIDMRAKLKEKLGVEFRNYVVLGVCNPPIAYQALQSELNLGLLLPCNVAVYEKGTRTAVVAVDAAKMLSIVGNPALGEAAAQVNEKLRRVIDRI